MHWIRAAALVGLVVVLASGAPGALAGDENEEGAGSEARVAVIARALEVLKVRLEARLGPVKSSTWKLPGGSI